MSSSPYLINSVLRAAKLLECFSLDNPALTNSQLAKMLGLHKSTITRLVYSLEEAGFLRKDKKNRSFEEVLETSVGHWFQRYSDASIIACGIRLVAARVGPRHRTLTARQA